MLKKLLFITLSMTTLSFSSLVFAGDCPSNSVCGKLYNETPYTVETDLVASPWYQDGVNVNISKQADSMIPPGGNTYWQAEGPNYIGYGFNVYDQNGDWMAYCDATASDGGTYWANAKCDSPKLTISIQDKSGWGMDNNYQGFTMKTV